MDQQWGGGGQPTQQSDRFYYQPQPQPQEQEHMLPPTDQSNMPQMPMQTGKNYRPFVDPEAQGVVDATSYPEPKESTHKIRGKSDILEKLFNNVSQELLMAKTFYFFFFSAFGSLFPLMAVYFKQLGMNPGQTGVLIGCRPFVEFVAAPFWGKMAERWQKGKLMLLCSVGAWIVFTLSLSFAQPPAASCIFYNGSSYILTEPYTNNREKRDLSPSEYFDGNFMSSSEDFGSSSENFVSNVGKLDSSDENFSLNTEKLTRRKRESDKYALPPDHVVGKSPSVVHYTVNYKQYGKDETLLSPPFSRNVFRESDVQKVFFLLLLLVLLGEFFSCPAIALADTAVLTFLGDDADQYGSQRMFGSLGWGLAMFFVGIALDNSTSFPNHPCKAHLQEKNYTICFAVFSVLMGCALMTATQFKFQMNEAASNVIPMEEVKEPMDTGPRPWNEPKIPMQQTKTGKEQFEEAIGNIKTRIFANTMREMPEWMVVFREFKTLRCGTFLFVAWWMGFGIGLIFGFLFWHLQDYGGTPTVFGIASIINHISEIFAYFFSFRLIAQFGHVKVLCMGLLGNVLRFLYISWITNPWWVLPFEFIQGITHAAVWAACCSYIAHNTRVELRSQAQGVLQGLHHGFGRGAGAIIGGFFINYFGTAKIFRVYGVLSLVVLGAFIFIHFYKKDVGFQHELPPEEDPRHVAEEGTALAPHGVPANPLPRVPSSSKINEANNQGGAGYGTYSTNGMLDIPGASGDATNPNNPFMQGNTGIDPGTGGGGHYTQYGLVFDKSGVLSPNFFHENQEFSRKALCYVNNDSKIEISTDYVQNASENDIDEKDIASDLTRRREIYKNWLNKTIQSLESNENAKSEKIVNGEESNNNMKNNEEFETNNEDSVSMIDCNKLNQNLGVFNESAEKYTRNQSDDNNTVLETVDASQVVGFDIFQTENIESNVELEKIGSAILSLPSSNPFREDLIKQMMVIKRNKEFCTEGKENNKEDNGNDVEIVENNENYNKDNHFIENEKKEVSEDSMSLESISSNETLEEDKSSSCDSAIYSENKFGLSNDNSFREEEISKNLKNDQISHSYSWTTDSLSTAKILKNTSDYLEHRNVKTDNYGRVDASDGFSNNNNTIENFVASEKNVPCFLKQSLNQYQSFTTNKNAKENDPTIKNLQYFVTENVNGRLKPNFDASLDLKLDVKRNSMTNSIAESKDASMASSSASLISPDSPEMFKPQFDVTSPLYSLPY